MLLYIQVYVEINIHIHYTVPLLYAVSTVANNFTVICEMSIFYALLKMNVL